MSSSSVPLKARRTDGLMHVKSVETQTSSRWCGVEVMMGIFHCRNRRCRVLNSSPDAIEDLPWGVVMHVKSVVSQSPRVGIVWNSGDWSSSSGVPLVLS
ncbi:hypothetical protein TNCV_4858651 [Trichonephila clavipes]|nr:hypothetical protein TNCV_4858651 [Trichonephila clavipes]